MGCEYFIEGVIKSYNLFFKVISSLSYIIYDKISLSEIIPNALNKINNGIESLLSTEFTSTNPNILTEKTLSLL